MNDALRVALLGLIEGVTEFLPVSSTGHLLLAEGLLRHHQSDLFNTVIQSGAVLAVLAVFRVRVAALLTDWRNVENRNYLSKLAAAFLITAAGGLVLKKLHWKLPETASPVAWATLVGGVLFLVVERWVRGRRSVGDISWTVAVAVAVAQLVAAVFPGASRSGTTILAALVLGVSRPAAAEFSFLLGVPTLLAAGAKETFDALREGGVVEPVWMLALGWVVAAVTAFGVVQWLLGYVRRHEFGPFAWYRIVMGGAMLALVWLGLVR